MLDKAKDKYKIVFEQTAGFDRSKGLSVTEAALAGMATPPQVIVAANDDMALGALEAVKARNLTGIAIIGFDALPEALAQVRDGGLTATIEQFPGKQSATGVDILDFNTAQARTSLRRLGFEVRTVSPRGHRRDL